MSGITIITSYEMVKIVKFLGFKEMRQKGSHKVFHHQDGRVTVIPFHNEDLGRGLIRKILNDLQITVNEYEDIRKQV